MEVREVAEPDEKEVLVMDVEMGEKKRENKENGKMKKSRNFYFFYLELLA